MKHKSAMVALFLSATLALRPSQADTVTADDTAYRGWKTLALRNGLVELQVLPAIGGRIIQFTLADKAFLWVNPQLAGSLPPANGLAADGGWFNIGGDKLWPAPQGWDNDQQWPGPPDAVLDGQPYALEKVSKGPGEASVRLTSGDDKRSGIRFSRVITLHRGSTHVSFEAAMKNTDTKPRRWGIWSHTQCDGTRKDGQGHNDTLSSYCRMNPASHFRDGYTVIFGDPGNPSFQPDRSNGLMRVQYLHQVGKIGLDCPGGWIATVDGASGRVFVQRFAFEAGQEYPDGASVEFWTNGKGSFRAWGKDNVMPDDPARNPYIHESEMISPFARLQPGESYTWKYDWYATTIGGDYPIGDCTPAGVTAGKLTGVRDGDRIRFKGRFGVFAKGRLELRLMDAGGKVVHTERLPGKVSPLESVILDRAVAAGPEIESALLWFADDEGVAAGELARTLGWATALNTAAGSAAPACQLPESSSLKLNFNPGWRLAKGSFPVEGTDDEGWERVSTPHTYHERFGYQGLKSKLKDLGPHTYRKRFTVPRDYEGRRLILEFEGIRQRGQFTLNGQLLGRVSHGVTPFGFDITPQVRFGAENTLQVEIDCDDKEFETGTPMCWFFPGFNSLYGGIIRNVFLHVVPEVHATLPLHTFLKTEGTYVYAENISTERRTADIEVEVQVRNDGAATKTTHCKAVVVDRDGREVASFETAPRDVNARENVTFKLGGKVGGLHFWQPGHPYLYDVYTIVSTGAGKPDVRKITTGFRKIEVRGAEFFLNNRALMTHGYTPRSQNEWAAVGAAYPDWLHDFSNGFMVEGNARLVRWEHTMPSPQDVASCDRVGLPQIVPGADRENDSVGREWELRTEIMRDTLIYCRNNPSVILWEAANNVLTPEHTREMIALRDRWDPRGYKRPMGGRSEGPEWVSWMYGVRKEKYRLSVDTEFLRDESPRRWWDQWSPPYFNKAGEWKLTDNAGGWNRNQDNMCVMQSLVHEQYYKARPGTGAAVCNGGTQIFFADSDSFTRSADTFRRSGPTDAMRVPKDSYFCNRTMWSNTPELWTGGTPAVFLPGHWNYPAGTVKPMYVFASPGIERVDLLLNGKALAGGRRTNLFLFTFPGVKWERGRIEAVGYDAAGTEVARSAHETAGEPGAIRMRVIAGPDGLRADGSDLVLIETEAVDKEGRRCPLAQNLVRYRVEGPAVWRGGLWEEDVRKYANAKELPVLSGIHRVIVRSTEQPGTIRVIAESEGLTPATVEIAARDAGLRHGASRALPAVLPVAVKGEPVYGPDLGPAPAPPPGAFDAEKPGASATGESILGLSVAFPGGAILIKDAADGKRIYQDRAWVFTGLPDYLKGADYLMVANDDVQTSAGEGVVFKIGKVGRVYVAYDDANDHFPVVSSPTGFSRTKDKLVINGRPHTLYRSGMMNGGELTYLGTSNWTDKPPAGANNYVVFIRSGPDAVVK